MHTSLLICNLFLDTSQAGDMLRISIMGKKEKQNNGKKKEEKKELHCSQWVQYNDKKLWM